MRDTPIDRLEITKTLVWAFRAVAVGLATAALLIAAAVGYYMYRFRGLEISTEPKDWGPFGDYLAGVLNPALGFFTLSAAALTFLLQVYLLAESRRAFEAQSENNRRQSFENVFFQLLALHHEIVREIVFRRLGKDTERGRDAFDRFYGELKGSYKEASKAFSTSAEARDLFKVLFHEHPSANRAVDRAARLMGDSAYATFLKEREIHPTIPISYLVFYEHSQSEIGHYFRNLYHLFKLISRSPLEEAEKQLFANLLRAQLSRDELLLLFYNCLSPLGYARFVPIIERFAVLEQVEAEALLSPSHHRHYQGAAYDESVATRTRLALQAGGGASVAMSVAKG